MALLRLSRAIGPGRARRTAAEIIAQPDERDAHAAPAEQGQDVASQAKAMQRRASMAGEVGMTKERAAKIVDALFLLFSGAVTILWCLHLMLVPGIAAVDWILWSVGGIWVALSVVADMLRPKSEQRHWAPNISPAYSGASVVLATGATAAFVLLLDASHFGDLVAPALIVVVSVGIAAAVVLFARRYACEIGEARFDTSNRDAQ